MKTTNMRVNTPVVRAKLEYNSSLTEDITVTIKTLIQDAITEYSIGNATELTNFRLKSIVLRSTGAVGETAITILGRKFFAMFKTNSYVASVSLDGHMLSQWQDCGLRNLWTDNFSDHNVFAIPKAAKYTVVVNLELYR